MGGKLDIRQREEKTMKINDFKGISYGLAKLLDDINAVAKGRVQTHRVQGRWKDSWQRARQDVPMRVLWAVLLLAAMVALAACSDDTPTELERDVSAVVEEYRQCREYDPGSYSRLQFCVRSAREFDLPRLCGPVFDEVCYQRAVEEFNRQVSIQ